MKSKFSNGEYQLIIGLSHALQYNIISHSNNLNMTKIQYIYGIPRNNPPQVEKVSIFEGGSFFDDT